MINLRQREVKKMNKYEITTERKKKAIVDAALTLFKNDGLTGVSIKEIAALAHVSQVSIYNYFGSKEALVGECANVVMSDTLEKAREILSADIGFLEKIESALLICTENVNMSISKYFATEALDDPVLVDLLVKNLNDRKRDVFRDYIELGKQENVIENELPTETILSFIDAINIMGSKLESDDMVTMVRDIHHLFLYGIVGKA
jgi:AcrR family transcriptional regulator